MPLPNFPGMPNVLLAFPVLQQALTLLRVDSLTQLSGSTPQWGIYKGAQAVIQCDTVMSMEVRRDFDISDFPVEKGAFASYNKVQAPVTVRFRFTVGGSDDRRKAMLNSIDAAVKTLDMYQATSPEASYSNMNLTHYDYSRTGQKGLGLLTVDVWMQEIRPAASGGGGAAADVATQNKENNTVKASGSDTKSIGAVAPLPPTKEQTNNLPSHLINSLPLSSVGIA